ncbi:hypothetical protein Dimus_010119 [Dionaea muscipula]
MALARALVTGPVGIGKEPSSSEVEPIRIISQPVKIDYFKETFLSMCSLIRENGSWWLGTGENRRRDENENDQEELEEEEEDSDSEAIEEEGESFGESTPVGSKGERSEQEVETAKAPGFKSLEYFYDAEEGVTTATAEDATTAEAQPDVKKKGKSKARRVDSSTAEPEYELINVQAKLDQALKANARFQELLQQYQQTSQAPPSSLANP